MNETLSKKEQQIVSLVAQEYSNKEIAQRMGVSPYTIGVHKFNIRKRTGIKSDIGLYLLANRLALVSPVGSAWSESRL